jgi:hypothetical protein
LLALVVFSHQLKLWLQIHTICPQLIDQKYFLILELEKLNIEKFQHPDWIHFGSIEYPARYIGYHLTLGLLTAKMEIDGKFFC